MQNKKTLILISALAVALAVSGCGKKETPKPVVSNDSNARQVNANVNENQGAGGDEGGQSGEQREEIDTSDWQTYRNEEYRFEVKYPEGWDIEEKKEFRIFNIEANKEAEEASKKIATESIAFFNGIYIKVNNKEESLENFIETEFNNDPTGENYPEQGRSKLINKTEVNFFNGMTALSIVCDRAIDPCKYILLESKKCIFQFSDYCYGDNYKLGTQKQCNQILSTFKFID